MARAGRKRKELVAREPSGKIKRPTRAEMAAADLRKREGERSFVLMQPHRNGEASQLAGSAFGRYCLRMKMRRELYDAGEEYANVVRRWRAARGIPTDLRLSEGAGTGDGPAGTTVAAWAKRISSLNNTMLNTSKEGFFAVRQMILDGYDIGMDQDGCASETLVALAVDLEFIRAGEHPFHAEAHS